MAQRDDKSRRDGKAGRFSAREVRALLWLLPVLAIASWLVWHIARPADRKEPEITDTTRIDTPLLPPTEKTESPETPEAAATATTTETPALALFPFDPNTIDYHSLVRLGFSRGEALGIIKYRERGKIFEIPEDFAACYQVSEEMYHRLRSYIRIGEEYRLKPFVKRGPVAPQHTEPQASLHENTTPAGTPLSRKIDLNTADSAALRSVSGIGEATVMRIMEYRTRLGGFVRVEQLTEVRGVTEQNYERIAEQIFVDTLAIQKIDINFASANRLAQHPYIRSEALRKLLKTRQLKGGWRTTGELEKDNIFTPEELTRLSPYLLFN